MDTPTQSDQRRCCRGLDSMPYCLTTFIIKLVASICSCPSLIKLYLFANPADCFPWGNWYRIRIVATTYGTARKSHTTIKRHQEDKLSKATSCLLPPDDCKTRMDIKLRTTKHRTITDSHNGSNNKQRINNNRTTDLERTAA